MDFIADLQWRGLLHQATDVEALADLLAGDTVTAYIGFDPTADSLHVGSLQQICLLRRLQEAGHRPIALVGGGTGMIGDPSFKSEERHLLDAETLIRYREGIRTQLGRFLRFADESAGQDDSDPSAAILVDNAEWLGSIGLLEFLRDIGKLFSVNEMVRKDSVRARLDGRDQGMSFTEFSYMLLQSYDFVQLFDRYGCRLQLGGSDQWGNITEGVDLIRRLRTEQAFGLTSPLVTKADGSKFGKTETGTVWLSAERTSPYEFFQFWLRSADSEVGSYLRRFTFLDRERIEELDAAVAERPERREAQRVLAREVTAMVHGAEEAARVEHAAEVLFTEGVTGLDEGTLAGALADAPTSLVTRSELAGGLALVDALVRSGLATSKSDARRQIAGGGISVNNRRVSDDVVLGTEDSLHRRWILLRRGRANQAVLLIEPLVEPA
ncbi:MAG: tyrosine--tRNA ligase [Acidimicrobiaceae bacterium]|nr:tyrosine--tRNA ligase [Acidimicrobiaceae bacterium]